MRDETHRRHEMKMKIFPVLFVVAALIFGTAVKGIAMHAEEKGTVRGTVTGVKIVEVELTVKDDSGKVTTVRASKDAATFKTGDRVVIKDGKVAKEVKPLTGGY